MGSRLFAQIGDYLDEKGLKVNRGTSADATIIIAPSSTKNEKKECDPDIHETKISNGWFFGVKAQTDVNSKTMLIQSIAPTSADAHDLTQRYFRIF